MSDIRLENLEIDGYHIYQDKGSFNFGIDAVFLANFALREGGFGKPSHLIICDFCTGTLPIPLIMYAKRKKFLGDNVSIDAFEIDKEQVELCRKSVEYNKENVADAKNIDKDIKVYLEDIKNIISDKEKYKSIYEHYDMLTVNPPYNKVGSGIINLCDKKIVARHEVSITFEDICKAARLVLKSNKKFYLINHSERLSEMSEILKSNSFEIKKIQFIYPSIDKPSNLCMIEAVKNAKPGLKVLEPIVIYEEGGSYTEKVKIIYGK